MYLHSTQQVGARCSLQRVRLAAYAKRKRGYLPDDIETGVSLRYNSSQHTLRLQQPRYSNHHLSHDTLLCSSRLSMKYRGGIYRDFRFEMRIIRRIIRCRRIMHCVWSIIRCLALPAKKGIYDIYIAYMLTPMPAKYVLTVGLDSITTALPI